MRPLPAILLIAACSLTACGGETLVTFDKELQHENGLSVARPEGFDDQKTATGFVFNEVGGRRTPRTISVERVDTAPVPDGAKERRVGEATALYTVQELGAGSGGTEYELKAARAAGSAWIVLTEIAQVEGDEPDFVLGWAVLERARLP